MKPVGVTSDQESGRRKLPRHKAFPDPIDVLKEPCCIDKCIRNLSPIEIEQCQQLMKNKDEPGQLKLIIKEIQMHTNLKRNSRNLLDHNFNFVIAGKSVCLNAWGLVFNVGKKRFRKAIRHVKKGHFNPTHGNKGIKRPTAKQTSALGWMRQTFERIGECGPKRFFLMLFNAIRYQVLICIINTLDSAVLKLTVH